MIGVGLHALPNAVVNRGESSLYGDLFWALVAKVADIAKSCIASLVALLRPSFQWPSIFTDRVGKGFPDEPISQNLCGNGVITEIQKELRQRTKRDDLESTLKFIRGSETSDYFGKKYNEEYRKQRKHCPEMQNAQLEYSRIPKQYETCLQEYRTKRTKMRASEEYRACEEARKKYEEICLTEPFNIIDPSYKPTHEEAMERARKTGNRGPLAEAARQEYKRSHDAMLQAHPKFQKAHDALIEIEEKEQDAYDALCESYELYKNRAVQQEAQKTEVK